jgi:hypothetical protein
MGTLAALAAVWLPYGSDSTTSRSIIFCYLCTPHCFEKSVHCQSAPHSVGPSKVAGKHPLLFFAIAHPGPTSIPVEFDTCVLGHIYSTSLFSWHGGVRHLSLIYFDLLAHILSGAILSKGCCPSPLALSFLVDASRLSTRHPYWESMICPYCVHFFFIFAYLILLFVSNGRYTIDGKTCWRV